MDLKGQLVATMTVHRTDEEKNPKLFYMAYIAFELAKGSGENPNVSAGVACHGKTAHEAMQKVMRSKRWLAFIAGK